MRRRRARSEGVISFLSRPKCDDPSDDRRKESANHEPERENDEGESHRAAARSACACLASQAVAAHEISQAGRCAASAQALAHGKRIVLFSGWPGRQACSALRSSALRARLQIRSKVIVFLPFPITWRSNKLSPRHKPPTRQR